MDHWTEDESEDEESEDERLTCRGRHRDSDLESVTEQDLLI
jgi:hypothetical protein